MSFSICKRSLLHPRRTAFLTSNCKFRSLPPSLWFDNSDYNYKSETTHAFSIFEVPSFRWWRRSNVNSTFISETNRLNLILLSNNANFPLYKDKTDKFSSASQTTLLFSLLLALWPSHLPVRLTIYIFPWLFSNFITRPSEPRSFWMSSIFSKHLMLSLCIALPCFTEDTSLPSEMSLQYDTTIV